MDTRIFQTILAMAMLSAAILCGGSATAQTPSAPVRDQLDVMSPGPIVTAGDEDGGEPDTGADDELGPIIVLQRASRYQPLRVFSDTQYLYNSNVLLTDSDTEGDAVFAQSLGASFSPRLVKGMATSVYVRHQFIRYDDLSRFDFDAQTAGLSLQSPVRDWFVLSGGFEANRYYSRKTDEEFLKDLDLHVGIRRGHYLHARVFLYYGYEFDWQPTSPGDLSRLNNALFGGVNIALLQPLTCQLAYRVRGLSYYQDSRFDLDHSLNASLVYKFNDYIVARAFVGYVANDSDSRGHDYEGLTAGGSLGIALRF